MADSGGESELTRASRRFLDSWRTQRLKDASGTKMPHFNPREFWSAILEVLRAYRRSDLCSDSLLPHHGIPPVMVDELALMLEELLAGRIPDKVLPLLESGAPSLRPIERRARVYAAAYVQYARKGLINDKTPVRTIREKFGISPRTASIWVKSPITGQFADPWLPSDSWPEKSRASAIASALNAVASEYAREGRAQASLFRSKRSKRRRPPRGKSARINPL